jgi:O-antigen ligase
MNRWTDVSEARRTDEPMSRSPATGTRVALFLLSVIGSGLLFVIGFPPAAPDRLPVLALAVGLALAAAWSPWRAVQAFAFLFPCAGLLARLTGGTDPIAWPALLFGGLAAGWSFRFIYDFESASEPSRLDSPLRALLLVWTLATALAVARASTLWAVFRGLAGRAVNGDGLEDAVAIREGLFAFASLASGAFFFLILRRGSAAVREKALRMALLGVAASAAAACFERAGFFPHETRPFWQLTRRLSGGAVDPNSLGLLCALALAVLLARFVLGVRNGSSGVATALLLAAGLLLSGSRAGLLLLLLAIVILPAVRGLGSPARRAAVAGVGVLVLVGAVFLLRASAGTLGARIAQTFDPNLPTEYRLSARPVLWGAAWRLFERHPVEGTGMGVFSWIAPDLLREEGHRLPMRDNPGSAFVQALAETGLVGLLLTMFFAWRLAGSALSQTRGADPALAGAGLSALAFLGSLAVGSHWMAPDVALLFFLAAALIAGPGPGQGAAETRLWKAARLPLVLLYAAACVVAALGTARPAETFRWSSRVGFHAGEIGPGGPFRWTRRRFALWLEPGQARWLTLAHYSPIPQPVDVAARSAGSEVYRRSLRAGESVTLALRGPSDHPRAVVFEVSRAFVPKRLGLSQDRRELALLTTER